MVINYKIMDKPGFEVIGKKTWISGQDNALFGQFWYECQEGDLLEILDELRANEQGVQTNSSILGVSCVDKDPDKRAFYYLIGIEKPAGIAAEDVESKGLETCPVPSTRWAVFECHGKLPEALVKAEMVAFMEWLPGSEYRHAMAPEMEVYFPGYDGGREDCYCEFWLPIVFMG